MLRLNDVCVDILGITVLRGLTVQLESGQTYAVVGRNGAGKTTLLRTIMGFTVLKQGSMTLAGHDLKMEAGHWRARNGIGYAPEDRVMFPTMSVAENLRLPCEAIGMKKPDIEERLAEAVQIVPQIKDMLSRSAAALSGGQGKMASLARALMVGTKLVLVDEPFQGLAPALARQYAEALSRMYELRPELCMVITESNRSLLDRVSCTTLTLERGELSVESATNKPEGSSKVVVAAESY
jgi:ABC-type branched-subunit amino acid transport system ATPase component